MMPVSSDHAPRPRQKHTKTVPSHSHEESKYSQNNFSKCSNEVMQDHGLARDHYQQQQQQSLPRYRSHHDPHPNNNKGIPHSYSVDSGSHAMMPQQPPDGMMQNMRRKVSTNLEHYGNLLHEMAFPILFRRNRNRSSSGSRTREGRRSGSKDGQHRNSSMSKDRNSDNDENFVFVDNIELHSMDGFVFSSEHEIGKGHKFSVINLNAPTWCDKCGDFIWGVYKQCLSCESASSSSSPSLHSSQQSQQPPDSLVPPSDDSLSHRCHHDRPKSFLRDEMDEFNKIFTELLLSNRDRLSSRLSRADDDSKAEDDEDDEGSGNSMGNGDTSRTQIEESGTAESQCSSSSADSTGQNTSVATQEDQQSEDNMAYKRASCPNPSTQRLNRDSGMSESPQPRRPSLLFEENDKLFRQLLDDLDNITTSNSSSIRKRRRARDLFSDWLFSDDARHPEVAMRRKTNSAFREFAANRHSADITNMDARRQHMLQRWRPHSLDCHSEDDTDSGYHTGHNTLKANNKSAAGSAPPLEPIHIPSQDTLTREELRRSIEAFNDNQHGLIMTMKDEGTTYQGFIRVHMNLIRPINMSISTRPPSIYDVMPHGEDEEEEEQGEEEVTSFYLPKDTSKVIHIDCDTTTQEVIKALLTKYKITDNPRKFALYEKLTQDKKDRMRRMADDEHPLQLSLEWTKLGLTGLDIHKFVLQENDTGEILWEAFSIPELENFLGILNREEEDYVDQVKQKYRLLRIQMDRRLKELRPKANSPPAEDKRSPVFV